MILEFGPDLLNESADPLIWFAKVKGPPNSPYEGGTFTIKIQISEDYPNCVPKMEFITPIFHPNIQNGKICLDLLDQSTNTWTSS